MFNPPGCIDTMYDYIPLLNDEALATIPKSELGKEVAIIGAGAAGMLAAHELLKMGLKPVIYEATNRMGGRLYSKKFEQIQEENKPFAELGAMRIPTSSRIFFHYAKKLGLHYDIEFPRAGSVKTVIYYKNQLYPWAANTKPPEPFATIQFFWELFVEPLVQGIKIAWEQGDIEKAHHLWQINIHQFKHMSLYQALRERSSFMTPEQINIYGALGIGHGGFNPIFQISFLEILRIVVNNYMNDNWLIEEGTTEFINRLFHLQVKTPFGVTSLAKFAEVKLNSPVTMMDYNKESGNTIILIKCKDNSFQRKEYRAVIFTGSMCAAHLINITNKTESGVYLFDEPVRDAIKSSQMISSSKTYICTESKFWLNTPIPPCITTDGLTKSTYCIDYPSTKHGVICLSYTWGINSMKLLAVEPKDRFIMFRRELRAVCPEIDPFLEPLNGEVLSVDWVNEKYQNGAFKIFNPGNDEKQNDLYHQFQSVLTKEDRGIYLAGDSVSWSGGWVEGALYTGLNSVYAVAKRFGAKIPKNSPLSQHPNLFQY